jgi:hypothetical protein
MFALAVFSPTLAFSGEKPGRRRLSIPSFRVSLFLWRLTTPVCNTHVLRTPTILFSSKFRYESPLTDKLPACIVHVIPDIQKRICSTGSQLKVRTTLYEERTSSHLPCAPISPVFHVHTVRQGTLMDDLVGIDPTLPILAFAIADIADWPGMNTLRLAQDIVSLSVVFTTPSTKHLRVCTYVHDPTYAIG